MKVAPSLLAADFLNIESELKRINQTDCEWLHLDVMDGHFVPNLTFGFDLIKRISEKTDKFLDVHLMISNPKKYIANYVDSNVDLITVHAEIEEDLEEIIQEIKRANVKVGISIKPNTQVEKIEKYLSEIDLVLVMTVEPGFGGQKFIESSYEKIEALKELKAKHNFEIEVDGGVDNTKLEKLKASGVDVVVAGTYVFKANDMQTAIDSLR